MPRRKMPSATSAMNFVKTLCISLFILSGFTGMGQEVRVLWIGNSYTGTNNLPSIFYNLSASGGDTVAYDQYTPGGYTFQQHSNDATTQQKIQGDEWDYVVLQAQSQEPSFPPNQVNIQTFPYATRLDSMIQANVECVQTVFYMTWGRKYGDAANCPNYPPLCTFQGMNARLRWAYKEMADANEALMAPVGMAWQKSWETDSTINLWMSDNSHPSLAGTYLTASVFYATLFEKSPVPLSYTAGLDPTVAQYLRQIAWNTVNDSLETWNIGRFVPRASFTYTSSGLDVSFEQSATTADYMEWQFGDGETSTTENPGHTYPGPGSYLAKLIVGDSCYTDTFAVELNLTPTGFTSGMERNWRVFPNPASREVMIQAEEMAGFGIKIYGPDGKLVREKYETGRLIKLDFSDLPAGIYQVVCVSANEQRIFRLMKE